jgi:hypothetical protein
VARSRSRRLRRPRRRRVALLSLALAVVAFLYYRPLRTYLQTRDDLARRRLEVAELRREKRVLQARLTGSAGEAWIVRSARRLGLVEPGERLFIVKGIEQWERAHGIRPHRTGG